MVDAIIDALITLIGVKNLISRIWHIEINTINVASIPEIVIHKATPAIFHHSKKGYINNKINAN